MKNLSALAQNNFSEVLQKTSSTGYLSRDGETTKGVFQQKNDRPRRICFLETQHLNPAASSSLSFPSSSAQCGQSF